MAKNILVIFVVILLVFSFSLPSFSQSIPVSYSSMYLGVWNAAWATYGRTSNMNEVSITNWANANANDTYVTVGLNFSMLPYLSYKCDFELTSLNETRIDWLNTPAVGNYVNVDNLIDPDLYGYYEPDGWSSLPLGKTILNASSPLSTSVSTVDTSGSGYFKQCKFSAVLMSDIELDTSTYKCITFATHTASTGSFDNDESYKIRLSSVTVYYDPTDTGAATLDRIQKNTEELKNLGIQVNTVNTKVDNLSQDVTNGINSVKLEITTGNAQLKNQMTAMQNKLAEEEQKTQSAINDASNKAHQDAQNTQNAIKDSADKAHQDSQNTQNAIKDLPGQISDIEQEEGNKASSDANNELGGVTSDLTGKDIDSKSWITKFTDFWNVMGSTNVSTEIQLPQFEVFGFVFWESQTIDLAPFFEYCAPLVKLVKFLLTLSVIWAMLRYFYNCVQFALGNSDLTLASTIFSFNPFKIK